MKIQGSDNFPDRFQKTFKKLLKQVAFYLCQKVKVTSSHFCEICIILTYKSDKDNIIKATNIPHRYANQSGQGFISKGKN